jgi:hypothetical protein
VAIVVPLSNVDEAVQAGRAGPPHLHDAQKPPWRCKLSLQPGDGHSIATEDRRGAEAGGWQYGVKRNQYHQRIVRLTGYRVPVRWLNVSISCVRQLYG